MRRSAGFTLIELLVVIGIIGALATVLLTQIGSAGQASTEFNCASNLRNIGGFLQKYKVDHEGRYPGGGGRKFLWNIWNSLEKSDKERRAFFCPEVASTLDDEDDEIGWNGPAQEFWRAWDDIPTDLMSYAARAKKYRRSMLKATEALVADANQGEMNHKSGNTIVMYGDMNVKKLLKTDLIASDENIWPDDDPDFVLSVGEDSPHKDLKKLTVE